MSNVKKNIMCFALVESFRYILNAMDGHNKTITIELNTYSKQQQIDDYNKHRVMKLLDIRVLQINAFKL